MKKTLKPHEHVANAIAKLFYPYVEVVIHDLNSQKVAYIANNFSKREVGAPSLLEEIQFDSKASIIGPYEKTNWDGRALKSISVVLNNTEHQAIGLMCLNVNVSAFSAIFTALQGFLHPQTMIEKPDVLFKSDWQEKINVFVHTWLQKHQLSLTTLTRENKQQIVKALAKEGAFEGKNAANYIAGILDLARATVYNYLKENAKK